tara:strand:- start:1108 stop:1737 length:630 start_codon:yes stop_codon:yes gene_type:complete
MEGEHEKMSINVYTNQKESIMKADNSSTEYVLKMNEEYNNRHVDMQLKIQELRHSYEDLENTTDKQDSSIRYMRGMLKNYVELRDLYKSMVERREELTKINNKELKLYDTYCLNVYNSFLFFMFLYFVNNLVLIYAGIISASVFIKSVLSMIICGGASIQYYDIGRMYNNIGKDYNLIEKMATGIDEDLAKIKEIEDGSDFLSEYIDGM